MCDPMYPAPPVTQTFIARESGIVSGSSAANACPWRQSTACLLVMLSLKTTRALSAAACAVAFPVLAACAADKPKPAETAASTGSSTPTTSAAPQRKSDQDVSLSQNIRDVCKIDDSERAPKFDFDSSQLSSSDRDILQQVAKCMTDGALKGKNIELIGRADPRGEQEYNMTLGSSRATAAHKFLNGLGIDDKRMSETSRGALDATGHDEEGWAEDRRVDIRAL